MDKRFIVERQGKAFVLYAGLLDEAHNQGLTSIKTSLIQAPSADNNNTAIAFAEVVLRESTYTGIGDANETNVSRLIAPHLIRMAETRAKARALRDAINVGMCSVEELSDDEQPAAMQTTPIRLASNQTRQQPAANNWREVQR